MGGIATMSHLNEVTRLHNATRRTSDRVARSLFARSVIGRPTGPRASVRTDARQKLYAKAVRGMPATYPVLHAYQDLRGRHWEIARSAWARWRARKAARLAGSALPDLEPHAKKASAL